MWAEATPPAYLRIFSDYGVQTVLNERLVKTVRGEGRSVVATFRNEYSGRETEFIANALVIEHGTIPNDDLYFALKDHSRNRGELDQDPLIEGALQPEVAGTGFVLYRIGDASHLGTSMPRSSTRCASVSNTDEAGRT